MIFFSIVVALYNKEDYISQTIQSVINQSFSNWELIVVDNGSSDLSPVIVNKLVITDKRISYYSYTQSKGPGATRNYGLEKSIGKWILFLDADDLLEPDFLEKRYELAEKTIADIIAGKWKEFDDRDPERVIFREPSAWNNEALLRNESIAFAPWALHAAVINRIVFDDNFKWVVELDNHAGEDAAFWFRLICKTKVVWINDAGAIYRLNTSNSRNTPDLEKYINDILVVLDNNLQFLLTNKINVTPQQYEFLYRVHEDLYRKAIHINSCELAKNVKSRAKLYLKNAPTTTNMWIRKILGIKLFNKIIIR